MPLKQRNQSKSNELWNISIKQKEKKILEFKELCFLDTLSDKFPANCTENLQYFIFSIPFFLIPFKKTLLSVLSFRIYTRTRNLRNFLFKLSLNLLFELPLKTLPS